MRRYFRVLRERDMNMTDEQIVESFYAMWDNFPESVMLIKKSREIIAVNLKAAEFNLKPGSKCSSYGSPDQHRGCRCNEAVDTQNASPLRTKAQWEKPSVTGFP